MAVSRKIIQRRIKSVRNTRKITKAMELVAAAKMRRAATAVVKTRPYATLSWDTVKAIVAATGEQVEHALLAPHPEAKRTLLVLFASDRGLAGGYNVNILKLALQTIKALPAGSIDAITIGKRAGDAMARTGVPMIASFTGLAEQPKFADIVPIGRLIIDEFTSGKYKNVLLGSTNYISAITQKADVRQLLPLSIDEPSQSSALAANKTITLSVTFEPNPSQVLDRVLPNLMETLVYQALLEAAASEHASRMMAMRNATDSATEMLDDLTFTYNQARQGAITQEIAEISGGKAALEK